MIWRIFVCVRGQVTEFISIKRIHVFPPVAESRVSPVVRRLKIVLYRHPVDKYERNF